MLQQIMMVSLDELVPSNHVYRKFCDLWNFHGVERQFFTLPSMPYQTQNDNSVASLLLLVMLGMMLFWTFKKITRWDNHNEINLQLCRFT